MLLGSALQDCRSCRNLEKAVAAHVNYCSCDDTAAAVLTEDGRVLSSIVSSQWELNAAWKGRVLLECDVRVARLYSSWSNLLNVFVGIVPALAARAHTDNLPHVINAAIEQR